MFTVDNIISDSNRQITWSQRFKLKDSLNHGKNILQTDAELAAYLSWYGEMHKVKCRIATQNFPFDNLTNRIHIIDWGCGQGIASLCILESFEQRGLLSSVRKVTLIEPSVAALTRAKQNIEKAISGHEIDIECINKKLPSDLTGNDSFEVSMTCSSTIHLFSNILDLVDISLKKTAEMIVERVGTHYVLCMGPCNGNKNRIDDFCEYFTDKNEFSNVEDRCIAHTTDTNYPITCKTRCFYIKSATSHIDKAYLESDYEESGAYDDYDTAGLIRNGLLTEKLLKVYQHLCRHLTKYDKIYLKPEMGSDTPDIVIVRKGRGIVVMNVFEGDVSKCRYDASHGLLCDGKHIASPLKTVNGYCDNVLTEKSTTLLRNAINMKNGWFVVRPAIWFPDASWTQICAAFLYDREPVSKQGFHARGRLLLLDADDFKREPFEALGLQWKRSCFTDEVYNEFTGLLKSNWHSFSEGDTSLHLHAEQRPLAESEKGKKQKIKGVAGSGKTQVLASRAVNCQLRTGGDILILTYNITLVNYIRYRLGRIPADFLWNRFTISNYHSFFVSQARNNLVEMKDLVCFTDKDFFEGVKDRLPKYSAILIDEVQDYEYSWLKILEKYFLAEGGEYVLFGDSKQNIYRRLLDADKEIRTPISGPWTSRLNKGQRFDNPRIASLAMSFQRFFFPDQAADVIESQLELGFTSESEVYYEPVPQDEMGEKLADSCIRLISDNNLDKSRTVILSQTYLLLRTLEKQIRTITGSPCMTTFETMEEYDKLREEAKRDKSSRFQDNIKRVRDNRKLHFSMESELLKVSSIHSYKGWDADNVILIIQPEDACDIHGEASLVGRPELIYTAITRAKKNLFVINMGNSIFDAFFRAYNKRTN